MIPQPLLNRDLDRFGVDLIHSPDKDEDDQAPIETSLGFLVPNATGLLESYSLLVPIMIAMR